MAEGRRKLKFGEILLKAGLISQEDLEQALELHKGSKMKLGEFLVSEGLVSEEQLVQALVKQTRITAVTLRGHRMSDKMQTILPIATLRKYSILPLEYIKDSNELIIAMSDPLDLLAQDDIGIMTNSRIVPRIATRREIFTTLDRHFGNDTAKQAAKEYTAEREKKMEIAAQAQQKKGEKVVEDTGDDDKAPVVKLVRSVLEQSVRQRASDIHIDAWETVIRLRYRVDGELVIQQEWPISMMAAIATRIKIMGGMDIAEKRKPQDGRISFEFEGEFYDSRVSILPSYYGEKIVMRVANASVLQKSKQDLGLRDHEMQQFDRIITRPNGIMLVTGPTGSGKSTTLYTALSELNTPEVNIITVEDPVEASIPGLNQVNVNAKAGLTFAAALKAILRQDPDIIMIGEIRDEETARIAVQASITGHLVVSTLHTNSACATISRLTDMGIENYLVADAVVGVIAQRLVRRLCPKCKRQKRATTADKKVLDVDPTESCEIFEPVGCDECNGTGYAGRMGVYEVMEVSHELKRSIASGATSEEMHVVAERNGMRSLRTGVIMSVIEGIAPVGEVQRLTAGGH